VNAPPPRPDDARPSHLRLIAGVLTPDAPAPLVLAGGYALQAHGLVDRPHADVDMATESQEPMGPLAEAVAAALRGRVREVRLGAITLLTAQLRVTDPPTAEPSALTLHKETLRYPPVLAPPTVRR
jgi:hypothetical protein